MITYAEYKLLVEQSPLLIWRSRLDKLCDYFNERWLDFRGRSMSEEFGNGWLEGVHPEDLEGCSRTYCEAFDRREIFEMHYRLRRHDGAYRWIFDRGVPVYAEDGVFAGYVGSCVDVTERIEAEQALRAAQEAELQRVSKLLPVCAWCKKIRYDDGYWHELEEYFREQHQRLTHCMCSDCGRRMLSQFEGEQAGAAVAASVSSEAAEVPGAAQASPRPALTLDLR